MKRQKRDLIKGRLLCGEGLHRFEISYSCSAGFLANFIDNPNFNYIVTAGHCYNRDTGNNFYHYPWGSKYTTYFIGQMVYHSVQKYDFGLIEIRGTHTDPIPMIRNLDSSRYRQLHIHDTTQVSSHGVHLCKSGLFTHVTCGYVRAFDGICIDRRGFMTDLIITDMHSYHGDSGGPVYFILKICTQLV
ncbi:S1 family peptidase [Gigaspora margarita]|uniref:S1 family peptidase n=1 Tax=Gigaspora margarita TaxID=4874 RepID=A0A8H4B240_GIGMA|nr:S1 family peptidase [Gigaspora margarita]